MHSAFVLHLLLGRSWVWQAGHRMWLLCMQLLYHMWERHRQSGSSIAAAVLNSWCIMAFVLSHVPGLGFALPVSSWLLHLHLCVSQSQDGCYKLEE